jgi:hypothetical protein
MIHLREKLHKIRLRVHKDNSTVKTNLSMKEKIHSLMLILHLLILLKTPMNKKKVKHLSKYHLRWMDHKSKGNNL